MRMIVVATVGGFIGALVSGILPSIATQYWMWKERPNYRWVLGVSWALVIAILLCVWLYFRGK